MPTHDSGRSKLGQEGSSFANALRDCLVCGISFVSGGRQTALLTREAAQILGLGPGQTLNGPLELLPQPLRVIVQEALSAGEPITDREVQTNVAGQGAHTLRVSAIPVRASDRDPGVVLVFNNLTLAQQLEQRIQQLDRLATAGTLAAGMAHEIKNALVAGRTFVDLLLEKNQDAELVEVVRRELARIEAIVNRMLKFSSPSRPAFCAVSLHEILDHSLRLVMDQLNSKLISLDRCFEAKPDLVHGDDYELQQAFVNLLLNALEATGPNGMIRVATEIVPANGTPDTGAESAPRSWLRITIKDTGEGVAPENLDRLFEPFFTTKPGGTGLGLAITRRIIHEHCGTIGAESRPGEGTSFQILLPLLQMPNRDN